MKKEEFLKILEDIEFNEVCHYQMTLCRDKFSIEPEYLHIDYTEDEKWNK